MGIEMTTPMSEIRDFLQREVKRNVARVITLLQYVGEKVVNDIRTSHISEWNDQTGNLRSSIGYIISVDGKPVGQSGFEKVIGPKAKEEGYVEEVDGSEEGRTYAQSLVSLYPTGIALIVVAGMEYASYVERMENKVVLAQGELEARKLITQMVQKLNSKLAK